MLKLQTAALIRAIASDHPRAEILMLAGMLETAGAVDPLAGPQMQMQGMIAGPTDEAEDA